jgi:putative two-component system response regulator
MQLDTVYRLTHAAEMCDEGMHDHVRRMSRTSGILARALGVHTRQAELIENASPMHDIGKLGIPEAILRKPRTLGPEERQIIETHSRIGADILMGSSNEILRTARTLALTHHERWDGLGYPQKLRGGQIPLGGRIVSLADVFDALVSSRCYKPAYSLPVAVGLIHQQRGRQFDPEVVDAFFASLREILTVYSQPAPPTTQCIQVA